MKGHGITAASATRSGLLLDEVKENSNLIIIALSDNMLISELNKAYKKLGFYIYIEQNKLILLDADGNLMQEPGKGYGLIQATQNPWNPKGIGAGESVVWMVTGIDVDGIRSAVDVLINECEELHHVFSLVTSDNTIMKIP